MVQQPAATATYDVARVRTHFPALASGVAYFDGPGGSQVPTSVAEAVAATMTAGISNRGPLTASARLAEQVVVNARAAMADLLGADAGGIVFGRSMTALTYDLSRVLARSWQPDDEVLVTRLDHDANIRPWVQAAAAVGARSVFVDPDPVTGELSADAVRAALSRRTTVVAVTAASNLIGTRPDLPAIADAAHEVGALFVLDGVHLTPHAPVDVALLGADVYLCSPYKFLGPHCGVLAAEPTLLDQLHPDKLLPSADDVPERFELGTLPYELLAGTTAAVDFLAGLVPGEGPRPARLRAAMTAVEAHEARLFDRLLAGLSDLAAVTLHGAAASRTPTALFTVAGADPQQVSAGLAERGVNAPAGSFYAIECAQVLGLGAAGGVRIGLAPYTDDDDVDRLLGALIEVVGRTP